MRQCPHLQISVKSGQICYMASASKILWTELEVWQLLYNSAGAGHFGTLHSKSLHLSGRCRAVYRTDCRMRQLWARRHARMGKTSDEGCQETRAPYNS